MSTRSRRVSLHAQALGFLGLAGFGSFVCLAGCGPGHREALSPGAEMAPPVEPPEPGLPGCIESEPLQSYVRALGDARARERSRALHALGATFEERPARFAEPGEPSVLDQVSERAKQRLLVVARIAGNAPFHVEVAKLGRSVRRIDERPRAHPVQLLVCGTSSCPSVSNERTPTRPIVIELGADETPGPALLLGYDYWWANVKYRESRRCP